MNGIESGETFRSGRCEERAIGTGEGDLQPAVMQKQGAREVESVGASERVAFAKAGHKSEDLGAGRHLGELLPILAEMKLELLDLGGQQKAFPAAASKSSVDLGEREMGSCNRVALRCNLAHSIRSRFGEIEFDEDAGVDEKNQRRSSRTISEASLPRFGSNGP